MDTATSRFDVLMDFARSCLRGFSNKGNFEEANKWGTLLREVRSQVRSEEYQKYLRSSQWKELRAEALVRANYLCQICASSRLLEVHHRKYPAVFGTEPVEDLTVLCKKCHEHWHND